MDGQMDRRTDGAILICHPKFLRGAQKCEKLFSFFSTKNISVFGYKVIKHLTN